MGGSNQSLFLMGAIVATQGTAAVPLLVIGLLLSLAALPGWTELILMWPRRVGGIAATCAEAFRPYSPVLANLTGVAYWWGWVPTCGLTAILSASALHHWYLPGIPMTTLAALIVVTFAAVNLLGVRWATRLAMPIAIASAALALLSTLVPVFAGTVDWHRAASFQLDTPFGGAFGWLTSAMAGLYLVGFAAPAFEAAACHVGETRDPERNVPKAMYRAAGMACLYFVAVPVIWLGALGRHGLEGELMTTLGPTFAPLLGGGAKAAAIWFMVFNMFHGTLQPLAGAARTLSQLSEDGLLPRTLGQRNRYDAPWVATLTTAAMAILFLLTGDPPWVIAAANFCYLIGIGLPSVAVWLLRRNAPGVTRPYRAPRGTIALGAGAAIVWLLSTFLGLEQFGLPTVLASLGMAYSGSTLYAWRRWREHRAGGGGAANFTRSLHAKLTGAMVAVMLLDGTGYLLAVAHVGSADPRLVALLKDIFVAVAILTVAVGLVLPGMIAHAVSEVAAAARRLAHGTVADLTAAMGALSRGDLDGAHARADIELVTVRTADEVGQMAGAFNSMQHAVAEAAVALDDAREGLRSSERALELAAARQAAIAALGQRALSDLGLDVLFAEVLERVRDVLVADSAVLYELDSAAAALRVRASSGLGAHATHSVIELAPEGMAKLTATTEPIVIRDWSVEQHWRRPAMLARAGVEAVLAVPIADGDVPYGWVAVHAHASRPFGHDEVDCLQAIANLLATAVGRHRSEQEFRHQALHDPLTGMPNRTLFADRLELALAQAERRDNAVAVLFLDLDDFKVVNDSLGHSAGDELLRATAARLVALLRPGDTVARFGGDEFVMICGDLSDAAHAQRIAERVIAALAEPLTVGGAEHVVGASIGIAVARGPSRPGEDVLREADAAMYRAKELGRGRVELYDEVMRARAMSRLRTESELRAAIASDQLRLHFQPIVALGDGEVRGVEALVRWQHPERGLLGPAEFVPLAEQSGAIVALGGWVLDEACRQAAAWQALRSDGAPLTMAVNLSARQVASGTLVDDVRSALSRHGLAPCALGLEITESVLMDDPQASVQTLRELKALGVSIILDDFGTGYSSLAYVRRFPIDVLKIDREFVADLAAAHADRTIVQAVLSLGRGLRIDVIAEGVQSAAHETVLRDLGCLYAQGFHYAAPLPAGEIGPLLGERLPARATPSLVSGAGAG
jgi:diguanylate cyclase (GGDEF)-like protein